MELVEEQIKGGRIKVMPAWDALLLGPLVGEIFDLNWRQTAAIDDQRPVMSGNGFQNGFKY